MNTQMSWVNKLSVTLGFMFLYVPMVIVVIYSFNKSKLVTIWGGWSIKWYGELARNEAFLSSAIISFKIALVVATLAVILGAMAAFVLVRAGRFWGRTLFSALIYAPLVMPPVITGLSMLLLFIGVNLDRGMNTIIIAQTTLAISFVAVVIASRLLSYDQALDEAALDLGATHFETFRLVTLPIIAPAVISGWLLAFSMSLDDLVIASFTSGPNATTLPLRLYSTVRSGVSPQINALSTIVIAIVSLGMLSAWLITVRSHRRMQANEGIAD
ncbi:Inner membrane ABC transporter permease protein YdcV [Thalassovita gelatinovora]|uniref:Inner membrane ABC transporter permease protein YdcV n=1 Tax=Thalassovita gelatinovora TaxID=53501 RepID=A0A0P1F8V1_THAGE|nr:ABC transporter permease subunit [Thalassovita gelatinovora]QIZ81297.1 ABC transporter permease subunit [Thalassovita gelatinovora]CUH64549.1 Inner membrane ABC transporter permease protein YdcV [Thalassovita gelatinovora]SEP96359.1 putrescine transport system permease protein [Thalassovita gelatinovora]